MTCAICQTAYQITAISYTDSTATFDAYNIKKIRKLKERVIYLERRSELIERLRPAELRLSDVGGAIKLQAAKVQSAECRVLLRRERKRTIILIGIAASVILLAL